jgi:2-polyprenyl-6-methoxyphenol hydroxylase-like FAD-dependent oxidoreductase
MDETPMSRSPLVIIGAGTGGLTLGRSLQRHNIPFRIYERADELPRHNYGISLVQRTYQPLLAVLQTGEHEFRRSLAVVKAYTLPTPVAERTAENLTHNSPYSQTQGSSSEFRANRSALERFLSEPIKQSIQYSSRFKSIKPASKPSDHVEVTFEGGSAVSELVIDCSGVHSPLRAALLPNHQPVIHPYVAINGKRYLRPDDWEARYAPSFGSETSLQTTVQFEHEDNGTTRNITARLEISINETVLDRQDQLERVSISYTYSRKAFPPEDALYLPSRPKQGAKDIPPQFYEEMASLTKSGKLSPVYLEAFNPANAGDDRLLSWLLRSVHLEESDTKALRDQGVLMMGDAAYAEPIVGSVPGGANHVIGQAMRLADRLAVEWKKGEEVAEMDLEGWLEPEPRSGEEDVAAHLGKIHELKPAKAVL